MPIQPAQWLVPERVIIAFASGEATREEFQRHNQRMVELLEAGTPLIHAILYTDNFSPPTPSIRQAMDMLTFIGHKNLGWSVMVGKNDTATSFSSVILAKLFRVRYRQLASIENAIDFLKQVDGSINWDVMDDEVFSQRN